MLGRVFLFKNGSRYAFFGLLLSFIVHELLEEAGAELQLILLIMGYCIGQHLLFVSLPLYLLPPYFHDVPGSICVISHEVITNGSVGFLPLVFIRGVNVVVLVVGALFQLAHLVLHFLDFCNHSVLVLIVNGFTGAVRVVGPDLKGSPFHEPIHFAEDPCPVLPGSSVPKCRLAYGVKVLPRPSELKLLSHVLSTFDIPLFLYECLIEIKQIVHCLPEQPI